MNTRHRDYTKESDEVVQKANTSDSLTLVLVFLLFVWIIGMTIAGCY